MPIASAWHTLLVVAVIAGLAYRGSLRAGTLRSMVHPDRIALYERTMLFEWLVLGLVLVGVWRHGASLSSVLGARWRSVQQVLREAGIGLAFLVASIAVTSMLGAHHAAGDEATQFLLPEGRSEMALWIALSITAGICEEAVYRGYLQRQFMAFTRNVPAGIVLSGLAFGAGHLYQGWERASTIAVLGVMGGVLAYWIGTVRPGMIAHALQDVLGAFARH